MCARPVALVYAAIVKFYLIWKTLILAKFVTSTFCFGIHSLFILAESLILFLKQKRLGMRITDCGLLDANNSIFPAILSYSIIGSYSLLFLRETLISALQFHRFVII